MAGSLWRWSCTYGSKASQHRAVLTAAAIRKRKQAEAAAQRVRQAEDEALREERRVRALGKKLFESWPENRRRQFDNRLETRLASQIDEETGTPVLPPDPYLRALSLKHHRAAGFSRLVRLQEAAPRPADAP